jgi:GntR family transcriptional regulator / MocR family aminotransferase
MEFHVDIGERGDRAARIYRELLEAILDGRLRPGERLPPTRELAQRLDVSRNTVAVAYERLTAEGFLTTQVGAGTFVIERHAPTKTRRAPGGRNVTARPIWHELGPAVPAGPGAGQYDFTVGIPDHQLFPLPAWRRLVARELRGATLNAGAYGDPAGHPALRAAIARFVGTSRAVRVDSGDVLVTQGTQQALDLIGRVLLEPGDCVAVEEPGYQPARRLFRSLGARIVGVPVDDEGLDVDALPRTARLVYTTPSHQFPLGVPMSLERRNALLAWAERAGAVIVEDDYDSEFRFEDRPLAPLQSLDRGGRVIYVGSFSKTLLPILRLGFLVAPVSLQPALRAAKQLADWHGELLTQAALAQFIDDGLLGRHIRRASREYAARHRLIVATLRSDFADVLAVVPSAAGLHLATRLTSPSVDLDAVVRRAKALGVDVPRLADYCGERPQAGLVLGYGIIPVPRIPEALHRLGSAFEPTG